MYIILPNISSSNNLLAPSLKILDATKNIRELNWMSHEVIRF